MQVYNYILKKKSLIFKKTNVKGKGLSSLASTLYFNLV